MKWECMRSRKWSCRAREGAFICNRLTQEGCFDILPEGFVPVHKAETLVYLEMRKTIDLPRIRTKLYEIIFKFNSTALMKYERRHPSEGDMSPGEIRRANMLIMQK
jgi:hypothetical protein